jgi:bla regulator protein blaR1
MNLTLIGIALVTTIGLAQSQTVTPARPRFEVATIKLNPECRSGRMPPATQSPGRWKTECSTLYDLIRTSYISFANGVSPDPRAQRVEISGGPDWAKTDFYALEGKAEGDPPLLQMLGPMTRVLLEDRFKLRVHRAEKEAPVYALTLAKKGVKLQRAKEGACIPFDFNHPPAPSPPGQSPPNFCGERLKGSPLLTNLDMYGMSMTEFAARLATRMDRDVVDHTGLQGSFDFHLEFTPDEATPGFGRGGPGLAPGLVGVLPATRTTATSPADPAGGPSIFSALEEQLGLKLEPAKGTAEVLVVDHAERPTEN